nr:hypothetical protein B11C_10205 [Bartonella sp. 1-1C]
MPKVIFIKYDKQYDILLCDVLVLLSVIFDKFYNVPSTHYVMVFLQIDR